MNESTLANGPGGVGELRDEGGEAAAFGNLPAKLRERILQARRAGFPAEYEKMLEDYYQRLAREEVADEAVQNGDAGGAAGGGGR
jgi:hypothetical protein